MVRRSKGPPPIVYILIGLVIVGGGYWFFSRQRDTGTESATSSGSAPDAAVSEESRISAGEHILISTDALGIENPAFGTAKQQGTQALANGEFEQAVQAFRSARQLYRNDPETLVYLNNAEIGDDSAHQVAVLVPIDVNTAPFSLEMLRGFAQAQHEVNQRGGINGEPLKLIIADDNDDPNIARQLVSELAGNSDILAAMGHWSSQVTLAVAPIYTDKQLVLMNPVSTSPKISGISDYVFRIIPNNAIVGRTMADYLLNQAAITNTIVAYDPTSQYSQSLKTEFVSAVSARGGQVVGEWDLSTSGFRPQRLIQEALDQAAGALTLIPSPDTVDRALQLVTVNQRRLQVVGDIGNLYGLKTLEVAGQNAVGMVLPIPWHIQSDPNAPFVQTSRQLWGADVNWATAMAYDASQALIEAIAQAPSRAGIQQTLASDTFEAEGVQGPIRFTPAGDRRGGLQLVEVQPANPSRSGTGYDFVPISP